MNHKGLFVVISGPSAGAGKTSVVRALCDEAHLPSLTAAQTISTTTRPSRGKEQHGVDYFFASKEEFEHAIRKRKFLEWAQPLSNHYYGTLKKEVEEKRSQYDVVFAILDVKGARQVKEAGVGALFIFISPSSMKDLEEWLRSRGDTDEKDMRIRLARAREEMKEEHWYDYAVVNRSGKLDTTVRKVAAIVLKEFNTRRALQTLWGQHAH